MADKIDREKIKNDLHVMILKRGTQWTTGEYEDYLIDLTLAAKEASSATPHDEYGRCERFKDAKRCDKPAEIQLCLEHLELIEKDTLASVLALLDAKIEKVGAFDLAGISIKRALSELRAEIEGLKDG